MGDVFEFRAQALRAFSAIVGKDAVLAERIARRVMGAPDVRRPWKDGSCDRSIAEAMKAETGKSAHELSQLMHVNDWSALCNFADFRPAHELWSLLADAVNEAKQEGRS